MNKYHKDRDFPEVKIGNSDIVAVIENPYQLQRVINEQNCLVDQIDHLKEEIEGVRNYKDSLDRLWRKAVVERAEARRKLDMAIEALEKIADPRKREHSEPDAYTTLGCVMNIADVALSSIRENDES